MPSLNGRAEPHLQRAKIASGAQLRAGRALLGWSRSALATAVGVHINTVGRWEDVKELPVRLLCEPYGVRRMRQALEDAGVTFFTWPTPGVRMAKRPSFVMRRTARRKLLHGVSRVLPPLYRPRPKTSAHRAGRRCNARTRAGAACRRSPMPNGRCPLHGGRSTGPRTEAGRARLSELQKRRWAEWRQRRKEQATLP